MLLRIGKVSREDLRPLEAIFDRIDVAKARLLAPTGPGMA